MTTSTAAAPQTLPRPAGFTRSRITIGLVLVALFWAVQVGVGLADLPISPTFMTRAFARLALLLAFPIWWLAARSWPLRGKLAVLAVAVVAGTIAVVLSRETLGVIGALYFAVPIMFSAWIGWLVVSRGMSQRAQLVGSAVVVSLVWFSVTLMRMDGLTGDLQANYRWRWSPRIEDAYLAERSVTPVAPTETRQRPVVLKPGDWPSLRGPAGDGQLHGVQIPTDWSANPPQLVWRERIGPAWSSPIIVDGRLFTQEQVDEQEAVVCLDAATGQRVWSHEYEGRLNDSQGGPGPRGTPTFVDGLLYTQGATGILSCLDARDGKVRWARDIEKDSAAKRPMWGFSSSPLVVDDVVITYAAGPGDKGLLAYRTADGQPVWSIATGEMSYSSPELVTLAGQRQVLFLDDQALVSIEPASGKILWKYEAKNGSWRAVQPAGLGDDATVIVGSEDLGLVRLKVSRDGDAWKIDQQWKSRAMKPGYNDFTIYDGFVYGFDGSIFCCVDLADGKRRWKGGRYGHGQVLLVADSGVLLVTSETGEAVLVAAKPDALHELGRIQAIAGKTWNHPVIAHGCLFVRNDEEIACYRLATTTKDSHL